MVRVGVIDDADRSYVPLQVCFCACEKREGNTVEKEREDESESYCKSLGYTMGAK